MRFGGYTSGSGVHSSHLGAPQPFRRLSSLHKKLYAIAFADEFGPLYAIYPLWFAAQGLSTEQISLIYMGWAAVGLVLEVPSGALADRVDRRVLLAIACVLRGLGLFLWMVWPSMWGICVGVLLWASQTALSSGALEAMVYDELAQNREAENYATVMARMGQANHLGIAAGTIVSTLILGLNGTMVLAGYLTVLLHLPTILLFLSLPRSHALEDQALELSTWLATLRRGVTLVGNSRNVAKMVVLGCLLEGLFILDEYVHLLGKARGAPDVLVPVFVGIVWLGLLAGGEVAARAPRMSSKWLGATLSLGAALTLLGLLTQSMWAAAGLGFAYAGLNTAWILSDARLQDRIEGEVRATVTSVRSFFASFTEMAALGTVGLLATSNDPAPGLILLTSILVGLGGLVASWATRSPQVADPRVT